MPLAVTLSDEQPLSSLANSSHRRRHPPSRSVTAAAFTGDAAGPDAWMLFVPDEPSLGMRFRYADLTWEVVDYSRGWIARLVVGPDEPTAPRS